MTSRRIADPAAQTHATEDHYHASIRVLHWLMAVGFLFMWGCGYAMSSIVEDDSPAQEFLFGLHISVGVTLLFLLIARIAIRLGVGAPPLSLAIPKIERIGAHIGHLGLYALPALIITAGWAETDFGGHGVEWFGMAMPKVFPTMETWSGIELEDLTATLHEWLAYTMLGLAVVHIAAVAKHRWLDGHDVLHRMTFSFGRSPEIDQAD